MPFNFIQSAIAAVVPTVIRSGLPVSRMTVQLPDGQFGPSGAPSGVYADVAGLVDIQCMNAPQPFSDSRLGSTQMRAATDTTDQADRHVWCAGYYPTLEAVWRQGARAIIDGIQYNIIGAESDSQQTQTRVFLQVATIGAVVTP